MTDDQQREQVLRAMARAARYGTYSKRESERDFWLRLLNAERAKVKILETNLNSVLKMEERERAKPPPPSPLCVWMFDDIDGKYETACGETLCFDHGPPEDDPGMSFCSNCGLHFEVQEQAE